MSEKKYIELQKALNVCEMHYQHCLEMHDWNGDTTADNIMRDIETIPTADVVEVVRCKDCWRFVNDKEAFTTYCRRGRQNAYVKPGDFCSYGEKALKERESK